MNNIYLNLAKSIIGQCECGDVDVVVLVNTQFERAKLVDVIAYLQKPMKFEGFAKAGVLKLFGKKVNIVITKNNDRELRKMNFGNARIYNLEN